MTQEAKALHMLVSKSAEGRWIAHCLDKNIVVQGVSWQEAISAMKQAVVEQEALDKHFGVEPLSQLQPAPREYFIRYLDAKEIPPAIIDDIPTGNAKELVENFFRTEVRVESSAA